MGLGGVVHIGSIPAPAGEPATRNGRRAIGWVYPRACGGTWPDWCVRNGQRGLSPRLRGNLGYVVVNDPQKRSIPAPAGEPIIQVAQAGAQGVYPRACGGTYPMPWVPLRTPGLSPRLRGNLHDGMPQGKNVRSIPAPAGEPWIGCVGRR